MLVLACGGAIAAAGSLGGCGFFQLNGGGSNGQTAQDRRTDEEILRSAEALRAAGVDADALREFERAIAENPTLTNAYLGAGDIYREQGDFVTAEARYRVATEVEPENFDAHYYLGLSLQLLDRLGEAVRSYLTALALRPDNPEANLNLATVYLQMGEAAQARPYGERAVRLAPDSGPARVNLGAIYAALGQHRSAVIEYQQAAELMPLTPELLLNLADSLDETGQYEQMAATLDQLIRLERSPVAYERLGSALFRLRRYEDALASFETAVGIDPGHFPAWNGVGVCLLNEYLWSGKQNLTARDRAIDALRTSLRIDSNQQRIVELLRRYD